MRFNIRWPLGQAPVWGGATVGERKALGRPYRRGEPAMYKVHLRARWLSALAVVACAVLLIPAASSAAPAGNNGTIKIDRVPFDDLPNNEPHPGCNFQVDFYNYDLGSNLFASVRFAAQPPSCNKYQTPFTENNI